MKSLVVVSGDFYSSHVMGNRRLWDLLPGSERAVVEITLSVYPSKPGHQGDESGGGKQHGSGSGVRVLGNLTQLNSGETGRSIQVFVAVLASAAAD